MNTSEIIFSFVLLLRTTSMEYWLCLTETRVYLSRFYFYIVFLPSLNGLALLFQLIYILRRRCNIQTVDNNRHRNNNK